MNRIVPLILAVALFMEMMDATAIATSLPAIADDIGTSPIALKLAMTSYLVSLAIFIPISGWMADRYGARNVFRWAIVVFMLGSLSCAMAYSLPTFVGARFFQGMGGAMMGPIARLVLVRSTSKKDLVEAITWLTTPALVGPMVGPVVGGFLTTYWGWQWIFLINIPIGTIGIIAATIYLPRTGFREHRALDWRGFILLGATFAGTLFGLSVISLPAISPAYGIVAIIVGIVCGGLFWKHAARHEAPLLSPRLLDHYLFRTSLYGAFVFRAAFGSIMFLMPLMLQLGFGLTPFQSGSIVFVAAIGAILAKWIAKPILSTFGFRSVLATLALVSAIRLAILGSFTQESPILIIMLVLFLGGIVHSTFFTGATAMGFADVPSEQLGEASAAMAVSTQLSFAVGVAIAGGLLEAMSAIHGGTTELVDFQVAFYVLSFIALFAIIPFAKLYPDAGSEVSGHNTNSRTPSK